MEIDPTAGRTDGKRNGNGDKEKVKEENPEHYHQFGALDKDHGKQRLALGLHPNGAGPKAQHLSRVSVLPMLLLR
jgi:hypothetical protein